MAKIDYIEIKVAAALTILFCNIKNVIEEINIHNVLKFSSGENLPAHKMKEGQYHVFGGGGQTSLTHNAYNVDFDTIAIGRVGSRCGCVFKVPKYSWITDNALYALTYDKRFRLDYLMLFLNYSDLNKYANRAAQPVISLKRISSINIPLIDESRQLEFIELIKEVKKGNTNFGEEYSELNKILKSVNIISQLQNEFSHQLSLIENLNQAILQEAVQGKLVPQDPNDEPAQELLKRIKEEKEKSNKKEKPLPPITSEEIPFEIPKSWVWCRLGASVIINPRNNADDNLEAGFIPMPLIFSGFRKQPLYEIRKWGNIKKGFTHFANGDLVIAKITPCFENSKAGIINELPNGIGAGTTELFVIKENKYICNEYLYYFIKRKYFLENGEKLMRGVAGQKRVPIDYIENVLLPLPPLSEQQRIVMEIENQLERTRQLKENILANQQATEQLLKALLHQAFKVEE